MTADGDTHVASIPGTIKDKIQGIVSSFIKINCMDNTESDIHCLLKNHAQYLHTVKTSKPKILESPGISQNIDGEESVPQTEQGTLYSIIILLYYFLLVIIILITS